MKKQLNKIKKQWQKKNLRFKTQIGFTILLVSVFLILGMMMEFGNLTGAYAIDFFEENLEVVKYTQDKTCSGNQHDPCIAKIQFRALKNFKANPTRMIKVNSDNVEIRTHDAIMEFQQGHIYTLTYNAYKTNPSEDIHWSWGPIE